MIYYVELANGAIREVTAPNRKEAVKKAKEWGWEIYKVTRAGGMIQYRKISSYSKKDLTLF